MSKRRAVHAATIEECDGFYRATCLHSGATGARADDLITYDTDFLGAPERALMYLGWNGTAGSWCDADHVMAHDLPTKRRRRR